jgi:hypothetical protein
LRRFDEARVRDLLHEPVAEAIFRIGPSALLVDEVEALELGERRHQLLARNELLEQRDAEGPADDGRQRENFARRGVEPVEPRLEGPLDERRDRELVLCHGQGPVPVFSLERAALDQVSYRFLEEEWVAARALGQQLRDRVRNLPSCRSNGQHLACIRRQGSHLDLLVAVRIALARPLAEPPRAELPLAPVEEEEAHR